jgi:hypothetical protein
LCELSPEKTLIAALEAEASLFFDHRNPQMDGKPGKYRVRWPRLFCFGRLP